jgi:hypothetical protein
LHHDDAYLAVKTKTGDYIMRNMFLAAVAFTMVACTGSAKTDTPPSTGGTGTGGGGGGVVTDTVKNDGTTIVPRSGDAAK